MPSLAQYLIAATALLQATSAGAIPTTTTNSRLQSRAVDEACTVTNVRKPWDQLTDTEKSDYIDAELCLQSKDDELGIQGATSRWDDIQNTHIEANDWIHFVGVFLAWHRYYVVVHENLLRDECGYNGSFPYWNEPYDQANGIASSSIFQSDSFGGNGTGTYECVEDGPFANLTLHLTDSSPSDYCLSRSLSDSGFESSSTDSVNECLAKTTYVDMWNCFERGPHRSGHSGTGGVMTDVAQSPGDPVFFLHHTWLDSQWAKWQSEDPENRTYWIGGTNQPSNYDGDTSAWLDYDGDDNDTTTLSHVLDMRGLAENKTAYDVMNISSSTNCAVYIYPDDS